MCNIFRNMVRITLFIFLIVLIGCKSSKSTVDRTRTKKAVNSDDLVKSDDVKSLTKLMVGYFENESIRTSDSTTVEQSLRVVPIWENREGHFLYAEQFESDLPSKPQFQKIYKIESDQNGGFVSNVYTLQDASTAIGQWAAPMFFDKYIIGDLIIEEGCTIYITRHGDGSYSGSTRMDQCKTTLNGATYKTSTIKLREDSFMNWEKGFDKSGNQIWGKELGTSVFKRIRSN